MTRYPLTPKVNQAKEFMEIASDFGKPLELLREAISNSFDAKATEIDLWFFTEKQGGRDVLKIVINDNGTGMDGDGLQGFFDLGNSIRDTEKRRAAIDGVKAGERLPIGEKGHGTKVYFNSTRILVSTQRNGKHYTAVMDRPYANLSDGNIPEVDVEVKDCPPDLHGTQITIYGYNFDQFELFNHERLKDYIYWFTKFGSCEREFTPDAHAGVRVTLKGLDRHDKEELRFGHPFPKQSESIEKLFERHGDQFGKHFCKKYVREGSLPRLPQCRYQAVFYVEGNAVKLQNNPMLRRPGKYQAPAGAYIVAERYGVWLCKDFIPVERRNEPVNSKGSEYQRLHAFFNCQELRLSANRGSVEPTPEVVKAAIDEEIRAIYEGIMAGEDMELLEWYDQQAEADKTIEKETKDFDKRVKRSEGAQVAVHKGVTLVEPSSEVGVLAMMVQLSVIEPDLFPFAIIDYDSHSGYDVIAKGDATTPIYNSRKYYVEYKHELTSGFNHSFKNLKSIVCWNTRLKLDDTVEDIARKQRTVKVVAPKDPREPSSYTRYFLDDPAEAHKIEVIVLRLYLKERLGIEFKPRDATSLR